MTLAIPGGAVVVASGLLAAAVIGGGAGALAGAGIGVLAEVGVPAANVQDYEEDLSVGRYLLVAHGSPAQATDAHAVLDMTDTQELALYR